MNISLLHKIVIFGLAFCLPICPQDYFGVQPIHHVDLSLEELMNLKVDVSTLTGTSRSRVPVSLTTITADDIAITPARNIYDLLETYVPGALYMNHHEGPHPGIRGIISDRNNKFLLLVNGTLMNQKTHSGAVSELENWELSDIEKIEIIRGPGSVTYGPGAIMGVINITLKSAAPLNGTLGYTGPYKSKGGQVQWGSSIRDLPVSFFGYASVISSKGYTPEAYQGDDAYRTDLTRFRIGYVGKDFIAPSNSRFEPLDLFRDFKDMPQFKAYLDIKFPANLETWFRYTSSGSSTNGVNPKAPLFLPSDTTIYNLKMIGIRQASGMLKWQYDFTDMINMDMSLAGSSQDFEKWNSVFNDTVQASIRNMNQNFSETGLTARTIGHLDIGDPFQFALGVEYAYERTAPGWGDRPNEMRVGDNQNIINSRSSEVYKDTVKPPPGMLNDTTAIFASDNGFGMSTISFLGESNSLLFDRLGLLLSGRIDKGSYTKWLLSPRVALSYDVTPHHVVKAIWQRSVRMNTNSQLYQQHVKGLISDPEVLRSLEGIYSGQLFSRVTLGLSGYYNIVEAIGWDSKTYSSQLVGTIHIGGFEAEASYLFENVTVGLSHAYINLLDFELADGYTSSGLSYSDYNKQSILTTQINGQKDTIIMTGTGNNLNNWANNVTKLFAHVKVLEGLTLHADTRIYWSFDGGKDGLTMLESATSIKSGDTLFQKHVEPTIDSLIQIARNAGSYGLDWRLNVAASYCFSQTFLKGLTLSLYCQNLEELWNAGSSRRYSYDTGISEATPHRVAWVREPLTLGFKVAYALQ
jgi:outer membrane receptor protein involved in Fe transport